MGISHVCMSCSFDMARVRARLEPHYGLPLVVCPDCGSATVRHKPRPWRSTRRIGVSLLALAGQLALLAACLGLVIAVCVAFGDAFLRGDFGVISRQVLIARLVTGGVLSLAVGTWLTAGFTHAGRVKTWLVFSGLAMVLLSLDLRWDQYPARLGVLVTIMTVALAGVPIGKLVLVIWHQTRRAIRCGYRRRRRARSAVL